MAWDVTVALDFQTRILLYRLATPLERAFRFLGHFVHVSELFKNMFKRSFARNTSLRSTSDRDPLCQKGLPGSLALRPMQQVCACS